METQNTSHKIKRVYCESGMESWIQPACSCGWEGRKEYAYEDWQMTNLHEQEQQHINAKQRKGG